MKRCSANILILNLEQFYRHSLQDQQMATSSCSFLWLFLILAIGILALPNGWINVGSWQWKQAGTMDNLYLGSDGALLVSLNGSSMTGNMELVGNLHESNQSLPFQMFYVGFISSNPVFITNSMATNLNSFIVKRLPNSQMNFPDLKIFEVVDNTTHICFGIYRLTNATQPCALATNGRSFANTTLDSARFIFRIGMYYPSVHSFIMKSEIYDHYYYWHIFINTLRIGSLTFTLTDFERQYSKVLNHSAILFSGGPATFSISQIYQKNFAFNCDQRQNPAISDYCRAPNMHLCTDLHYRAYCGPPLTCVHGIYSYYLGRCECERNYAGVLCDETPCIPFCIAGDCMAAISNRCRCDYGFHGDRCEVLNQTVIATNFTIPQNVQVIIDFTGTNQTLIHISGTLIILNGTRLRVDLLNVPFNGQHLLLLEYGAVIGSFEAIDFMVNGQPLASCYNYESEYAQTGLSVLFGSSCTESPGSSNLIAMFVTLAVVAVVVTLCILLAYFNLTFRRFICPFDRPTKRPYRKLTSQSNLGYGDDAADSDREVNIQEMTAITTSSQVPEVGSLARTSAITHDPSLPTEAELKNRLTPRIGSHVTIGSNRNLQDIEAVARAARYPDADSNPPPQIRVDPPPNQTISKSN